MRQRSSAAALIAILNTFLRQRNKPDLRTTYKVKGRVKWTDSRGPELDRLIAEGRGDVPSMTMKEFRRRER